MKKDYVASIITYVESHIEEPLSVDIIAREVGLSKVYLYKIFYIYTGLTLMEYCRNRKLEYCRHALSQNNLVIDVSFKYGFNSTRSFSRAFSRYFETTPSKVKGTPYKLPLQLSFTHIGGMKMLTYLSEPNVIKMNEIYCLCHQVISKEPEDNVIDFMMDYRDKYKLNVLAEYGYDIPTTEEQNNEGLRGYEYLLVLSKDDFDKFNGPIVTKKVLPESNYLSILITDPFVDPFERIPNAWKTLMDALKTDYTYNTNPLATCLEENIEHDDQVDMKIYAPIMS